MCLPLPTKSAMILAELEVLYSKSDQLSPAKSTTHQDGENCSVSFATGSANDNSLFEDVDE
jgi:hypothetical protein